MIQVFLVLIFIILLSFLAEYFFPVMRDYNYHIIFLCFVIFMVWIIYEYYTKVWSKPSVSVRAMVKKKEHRTHMSGKGKSYFVTFLLADRSELDVSVSKLQYKSVDRGIIVDLVYQGCVASSIKRSTDEMPIKYNDLSLRKRKK